MLEMRRFERTSVPGKHSSSEYPEYTDTGNYQG
jgi:hypothetical protein